MRRFEILIALLVLFATALLTETAGASTPRPIVYSKVTWERARVDGVTQAEVKNGGLFAISGGKARPLTEVPGDDQPSISPDGGTIAFIRAGDLYVMEADGSGQRQLTSGLDVDERPLVSPNGRYVLFTRRPNRQAPGDLFTIPLTGGSPHSLTTWPGEDREASFSPQGRAVVFVRSLPAAEGGTNDELYSVRPTGADMARLTRSPEDELHPHYFAKGIVFSRRKTAAGGPASILTMHRNGAGADVVVARKPGATVAAISPNGRLLLFEVSRRGLWVKRLVPSGDGAWSRASRLSREGSDNLVFSPDGRRVAGTFLYPGGFHGLRSIDVLSGDSRGEGEIFEPEAPGPVQTSIGRTIAW